MHLSGHRSHGTGPRQLTTPEGFKLGGVGPATKLNFTISKLILSYRFIWLQRCTRL